MLGVDEGADSAGLLRLRDGVQGEGGLARGLGAEDLDDAAARQAAHAQGQVETHRAGGNHGDVLGLAAKGHDGALAKLLLDGGNGGLYDFQFLLECGHFYSPLVVGWFC